MRMLHIVRVIEDISKEEIIFDSIIFIILLITLLILNYKEHKK